MVSATRVELDCSTRRRTCGRLAGVARGGGFHGVDIGRRLRRAERERPLRDIVFRYREWEWRPDGTELFELTGGEDRFAVRGVPRAR